MYRVYGWAEVHRLFHREGWANTKIADELGMSRNTVARLLELGEAPRYERAEKGSKLDPHWGSGKRGATCSPTRKSSDAGWHKVGNVLAALPKSPHKDARAALAEIYNAEDCDHAEQAAEAFAEWYGTK